MLFNNKIIELMIQCRKYIYIYIYMNLEKMFVACGKTRHFFNLCHNSFITKIVHKSKTPAKNS